MFLIPREYFHVRNTKKKGRGVFAKKDIEAGTIIGDYIGTVLKDVDEDEFEKKEGFYLMYYHEKASIFPEKDSIGIHLLNNSCTPNCWMFTYRGHTLFFAIRKIFKGEELTVSYLLSPDDECKPCTHDCLCESEFCTGTMHISEKLYDKWVEVEEKEYYATKRERVRYNKLLPKLESYPKNLSDKSVYTLFASNKKNPVVLKTNKLPKTSEIRKIIRESGRPIKIPKLKLKILGVSQGEIVSKPAI